MNDKWRRVLTKIGLSILTGKKPERAIQESAAEEVVGELADRGVFTCRTQDIEAVLEQLQYAESLQRRGNSADAYVEWCAATRRLRELIR